MKDCGCESNGEPMLILNFILQNVIRGFMLALTLAATKFFISGYHIGENTFVIWMIFGFFASLFLKFLDAVEIYEKLKELEK